MREFLKQNSEVALLQEDAKLLISTLLTVKVEKSDFAFIKRKEEKLNSSKLLDFDEVKELCELRNKYFYNNIAIDEISLFDELRSNLKYVALEEIKCIVSSLRKSYKENKDSFSEDEVASLTIISSMIKDNKLEIENKDFFNLLSLKSRLNIKSIFRDKKDLGLILTCLTQDEITPLMVRLNKTYKELV